MPRQRKPENRPYPKGWSFEHGAFYYNVPKGDEARWDGKRRFRLGKTLAEAGVEWAKRVEAPTDVRSIDKLLDRYQLEVVPTKAPKTQTENVRHMVTLRKVFGRLPLSAIKPRHIYQYVDRRKKRVEDKDGNESMVPAVTVAHREIEVLSHAFTKAVQWGYLDRHPFKGEVRLEGEPPRDRLVEDWEITECLALDPKRKKGSVLMIQAYLRLKLLTGIARGDLLRLEPARDFTTDGIDVTRHKTAKKSGKRTLYEWTDELRAAVQMALDARPVDIAPHLFCNRLGEGYVDELTGLANGWDSMWQRFMDRVLDETKVTDRFTEHDLRRKVGSDAETLEHARALLAHVDSKITQRVYRRKPERVRPLR